MFCRSCGAANEDQATACVSCGNPIQNPYQFAATSAVGAAGTATGPKPDNFLVPSILVTFCCCLPFGIAGIVYASRVDTLWNTGNPDAAIEAAANAKKYMLIGLITGLVINGLAMLVQILAIVGSVGAANQGQF